MLQPKKTKFRRVQKGRAKGNAQRGNQLAFGSFGIKSLGTRWITGRQIEAARIAVTRYMQRQGQVWVRIFPDKPITKKPADVRMGKGKGSEAAYNKKCIDHAVTPADNPAEIRRMRRTIAQMKTILRERELNNN